MRSLAFIIGVVAAAAAKQQSGAAFDPYAVLGVSRDATGADIRKVYRKLTTTMHPDMNPGNAQAAAKFAELARAYEILTDDAARESFNGGQFHTKWEYDAWKAKHGPSGFTGKGFFPMGGAVVPLTEQTFHAQMHDRSKPILIMFYADWCVHCQHFAKHYREVGLALGDDFVVSAINCGETESICAAENVPGYPTLRLLAPRVSGQPDAGVETWEGPLEAAEPVIEWAKEALSNDVVMINSKAAFIKHVMKSNVPWIVDFSGGPWCPPCGQLKPILRRVASRLHDRVKVGIVDCDKLQSFCQSQHVQMYPLLRVFGADPAQKASHNGGRGTDLILSQQAMHFPPAAGLELAAAVMEALIPKGPAAIGATGDAPNHDDL